MVNASYPRLELSLLSVDGAYVLISNLISLCSIFGCFIICVSYITKKEIRTTSRLLLVCLSIADVFVAIANFFNTSNYYRSIQFPLENTFMCQGGASIYVYAQVCAALWTAAIAFYLFLCVATGWIIVANRIVFLLHGFCWIMPLVVSISADLSGVYGYDISDLLIHKHPTPCWISDRVSNPKPWYLLTVEGWVMASLALVAVLYVPVTFAIYCKKNKGKQVIGDDVIEELAIQTADKQLRFIPVIYFCTRIWGTGYFLFTRFPENSPLRNYDWLLIIKAFGDNSQGLVNAIFFCLATKQIRQLISKRFWRAVTCCFGWCLKHRIISHEEWMKVPTIVRKRTSMPRRSRCVDGSDLDLSGISLELPPPEADLGAGEDEVIFER